MTWRLKSKTSDWMAFFFINKLCFVDLLTFCKKLSRKASQVGDLSKRFIMAHWHSVEFSFNLFRDMGSGSFKNLTYKRYIHKLYIFNVYICRKYLPLNNLQELIYHKSQPNYYIYIYIYI